jgi:phosphopantothenoylcysteine decarboxylase/phosphopantothenate--cysteine ligase
VHFILGQLYSLIKNPENAKNQFNLVVKSPATPFEMQFNARINRAFLGRDEKVKKDSLKTLELDKNPDILLSLAKAKKDSQVIIGFAAETYKDIKDLELSGFTKLASKSLDLIYVNNVSGGAIFGSDKTQGLIIDKEKNVIEVPEISKDTLSDILLDQLVSKLG